MLTRLHCPPDETPTLPPISILTTPYAFTPPPLPSLRLCSALQHASDTGYHPYACGVPSRHCLPSLHSWSALLTFSRHCLPSLHSWSALLTFSRHCLPSLRLRSALPTCSQHHL
ncbi:hypothetical protein O181_090680 [Austropuccinia psidii MF-1]|uniref:Uncharacterized protein n=1 Tax=Austropuccinia psidii MF-1 TaxID=1389203 RepID=A0A9Q3IVG7_9BASI|nr:hypothetical protein [Austropuccinia psidii MF-1]